MLDKMFANPDIANPKLVLLASSGRRGDALKYEQQGFSAYLQKPVNEGQLFDCLMAVFGALLGRLWFGTLRLGPMTLDIHSMQIAGLLVIVGYTMMRMENEVDGLFSLYIAPLVILGGLCRGSCNGVAGLDAGVHCEM